MTWIKTILPTEDEAVRKASEDQRHLYPVEYVTPVHPTLDGESACIGDGVIAQAGKIFEPEGGGRT